jgi:hypothetical protein
MSSFHINCQIKAHFFKENLASAKPLGAGDLLVALMRSQKRDAPSLEGTSSSLLFNKGNFHQWGDGGTKANIATSCDQRRRLNILFFENVGGARSAARSRQ